MDSFDDPDVLGPALRALGDDTRRQVVGLLSSGPRRAGELAEATGTTRPAMSRHLRVLLEAGLVDDERPPDDARARAFRLRPESMTALQAWLDQLQAHWDEQLRSFKEHAELRGGGRADPRARPPVRRGRREGER